MNREKLISYSFYCGGEYGEILKAVREDRDVRCLRIENALTIFDDGYPKELLDLKYPPFVLYYKGDLKLLCEEKYAIVGSRDPCAYALKATEGLARHHKDKVLVSGLAKGIDACAHRNAEKTIGILGCGIDYIYPRCNEDLIRDVAERGLILSEYPSLSKPLAFHFPFRNRIIAALSQKVCIMQSRARSGTMTSVNEALELGRQICVLPYDIFTEEGVQNNQMIYEGAQPILREEIAF
ncbi:MAG: DNA-protecting protein DprA [Erysipelotrichaceae bacterium]|nr:DNA-protecting protein DprA [Erysipelotrichaceae bacterium]